MDKVGVETVRQLWAGTLGAREHHDAANALWVAVAAAMFVILHKVDAPYGRHGHSMLRFFEINPRFAWMLSEGFSLVTLAYTVHHHIIPLHPFPAAWQTLLRNAGTGNMFLMGLFCVHYIQRSFIYPMLMAPSKHGFPILTFLSIIIFQSVNAHLLTLDLLKFAPTTSLAVDLATPRWLLGALLFVYGMAINIHSDKILRDLRKDGVRGVYRIPYRGMFRFVSCANYYGELIEWCGFALAAWSPAALVFAVWTAGNLVPRARRHHQWYIDTFGEKYPKNRAAIIPFVY